MGRKKTGKRTETVAFSLDLDIATYLRMVRNSSRYVNDAIRQKIKREKNLEVLLKEIKREKRKIAMEMTKLQEREEEVLEKIERKKQEQKRISDALFNSY